jgi:hypothetical protein
MGYFDEAEFGRISSVAPPARTPGHDRQPSEGCGNCEAGLKKAKCSDGQIAGQADSEIARQ